MLGVRFYLMNGFKILLSWKMKKCEANNIQIGICVWPWWWEKIVESSYKFAFYQAKLELKDAWDVLKRNEPMIKLEFKIDY